MATPKGTQPGNQNNKSAKRMCAGSKDKGANAMSEDTISKRMIANSDTDHESTKGAQISKSIINANSDDMDIKSMNVDANAESMNADSSAKSRSSDDKGAEVNNAKNAMHADECERRLNRASDYDDTQTFDNDDHGDYDYAKRANSPSASSNASITTAKTLVWGGIGHISDDDDNVKNMSADINGLAGKEARKALGDITQITDEGSWESRTTAGPHRTF